MERVRENSAMCSHLAHLTYGAVVKWGYPKSMLTCSSLVNPCKSIPGAATVLVSKGNVFQFTKGDLSHMEMKSVTDSNGENESKKIITENRRNPWQLAIVQRKLD